MSDDNSALNRSASDKVYCVESPLHTKAHGVSIYVPASVYADLCRDNGIPLPDHQHLANHTPNKP